MTRVFPLTFIFALSLISLKAVAQLEPLEGDTEVEQLYDQVEQQEERRRAIPTNKGREEQKAANLSDLAELAPFSDVAVISRKYLPKTGRLEFSGQLSLGLNNEFFTALGGGTRISYGFNERYGVELAYFFLTDMEKDITKNLRERINVTTRSLVRPQGFGALTFKWSPIYGKLNYRDKSIIPYDIFIQGGLGYAQTEEGADPGVSVGAGQLFALTKSMAVRWDFTWNYYQASIRQTVGVTTEEKKTNHSDILVGIGISFFWPEASYR